MLNIILLEPEIPANTGNIGRTCVAAGARLHLIEPMGFQINEKQVRRAGLDYWDKLDIEEHNSLEEFLEKDISEESILEYSDLIVKLCKENDEDEEYYFDWE